MSGTGVAQRARPGGSRHSAERSSACNSAMRPGSGASAFMLAKTRAKDGPTSLPQVYNGGNRSIGL